MIFMNIIVRMRFWTKSNAPKRATRQIPVQKPTVNLPVEIVDGKVRWKSSVGSGLLNSCSLAIGDEVVDQRYHCALCGQCRSRYEDEACDSCEFESYYKH